MIGDGQGYNQLAVTDYYEHGMTGGQVYERFPVRAAMSTYSVGGSYDPATIWGSFDVAKSGYTDSSAAATAMATGSKTLDTALGVDENGTPLVNAFQVAEASGRSTGVVSTMPFSHATPAGFVAHNPSRKDFQGIAQEMVFRSATDVIMGGGHPCFDAAGKDDGCVDYFMIQNPYAYVGGLGAWNQLTSAEGALGADADGDGDTDRWSLVQTREEFQNLGQGNPPSRVIGVAQVEETLQSWRPCPTAGDGSCFDEPFTVPQTKTVPTLAEMANAALNVLDANDNGFALMIEGGAIDYAGHFHWKGRLIEEQMAFNHAVRTVVDWIENHGGWEQNLLVVTGDHETGYLTGPGSDPGWTPVVNRGRGQMPLFEFHSNNHTNHLIPLFAKGVRASELGQLADQQDPRRGAYLDNTELGTYLKRVLG
jgi:alkaline phosphatase